MKIILSCMSKTKNPETKNKVANEMVWFLIMMTVVTYGFIMKFVLSNVMKDRQPVQRPVSQQTKNQSFAAPNLIPTQSTR
jgi:hypothetical protein